MNANNSQEVQIASFSNMQLTNIRIVKNTDSFGLGSYESIPLGSISHLRAMKKSRPILMYLSIVSLVISLVAFFSESKNTGIVFALLAIALFVAFKKSLKEVFEVVAHSGTSLEASTSGVDRNTLVSFMNSINLAVVNLQHTQLGQMLTTDLKISNEVENRVQSLKEHQLCLNCGKGSPIESKVCVNCGANF